MRSTPRAVKEGRRRGCGVRAGAGEGQGRRARGADGAPGWGEHQHPKRVEDNQHHDKGVEFRVLGEGYTELTDRVLPVETEEHLRCAPCARRASSQGARLSTPTAAAACLFRISFRRKHRLRPVHHVHELVLWHLSDPGHGHLAAVFVLPLQAKGSKLGPEPHTPKWRPSRARRVIPARVRLHRLGPAPGLHPCRAGPHFDQRRRASAISCLEKLTRERAEGFEGTTLSGWHTKRPTINKEHATTVARVEDLNVAWRELWRTVSPSHATQWRPGFL